MGAAHVSVARAALRVGMASCVVVARRGYGRGAAWRGRAAKKEKKAQKRKMIPPARRFPIPRHGVGMGSGCGRDQSVVARTARGWCEAARISYLLDKPADPTILSHRTVEPNLTARKLTSLATHAIPIPDKRGLTHRSRRLRGDIAT